MEVIDNPWEWVQATCFPGGLCPAPHLYPGPGMIWPLLPAVRAGLRLYTGSEEAEEKLRLYTGSEERRSWLCEWAACILLKHIHVHDCEFGRSL